LKKIISHRGNINGPVPEKENSPEYILDALKLGYEVEIDVWYFSNTFFLGHDEPDYQIEESFLENERLWCHAKNKEALQRMLLNKKIHCFWHQEDDYAVTSKGFIWAYPGKPAEGKAICVMPERSPGIDVDTFIGVCTDFCERFK